MNDNDILNSVDSEISKEFNKIKNDKIIFETTSNSHKKNYANEILNTQLGNELKNCNLYYNKTYKLKIPLKVRFKNFLNKLINVLD